MKRVILETPYAGDVELNTRFARACMDDCLDRGEAPFVSHLLYTQVLDDKRQAQRALGMVAGFAWREAADYTVFYTNLGWSNGMLAGLTDVESKRGRYEVRKLPEDWNND